MSAHAGLRLRAAALARYGLPDITYPLAFEQLQQAIVDGGELPFAEMLCALQTQAATAADWEALEPALDRLAELLSPEDARDLVTVAGDDWWLELGAVDLDACIVTIQREDRLLAAIAPRADGRLRVAVYRPLDGKAIGALIGLGRVPDPEHGVSMGRDNWGYALDASAGMGQWYAADVGRSYLSYWEQGLGVAQDGSLVEPWRAQRGLLPRPAGRVATELGIQYAYAVAGSFLGDDDR